MNIFRSSDCPIECARVLEDRHVIKMTLETAQILASALALNGVVDSRLYRPTHKGHPCVVWAAQSQENATWTLAHGRALAQEYTRRFSGKRHKSEDQLDLIEGLLHAIPAGGSTSPPICVEDDLRALNLHEAYRAALCRKYSAWSETSKRPLRWTNSFAPNWAPSQASNPP